MDPLRVSREHVLDTVALTLASLTRIVLRVCRVAVDASRLFNLASDTVAECSDCIGAAEASVEEKVVFFRVVLVLSFFGLSVAGLQRRTGRVRPSCALLVGPVAFL